MEDKPQTYATYPIGLVPGPTSVPKHILEVYGTDYASADLEDAFFDHYAQVQRKLATLLDAHEGEETPIIMLGEGMLALWSGLKSCIAKGDRVLALSNGIYGQGVGEMAKQIGAEVKTLNFSWEQSLREWDKIREEVLAYRPQLITVIHCDTPSGILNPLNKLGEIAREVDGLLYVDFVSSAGGAELSVHESHIDLGLLGSQKVFSMPPSLSVVTVSNRAWKRIEEVKYVGYDALLPWKRAVADKYFPYTFDWHSLSALSVACDDLLKEGIPQYIKKHREVAQYCRNRLKEMGIKLFPQDEESCSPTVTVAYVPLRGTTTAATGGKGWNSWEEFDKALRRKGVVVGGSYGDLKGKVFRIGHMGSQANLELVGKALDVIQQLLADA